MRYRFNYYDRDDFFDYCYSQNLRRWENVFPTPLKFFEIYNPFIISTLDNTQRKEILDYLWRRFNAEHRGEWFRYSNLGKIVNQFFSYVSKAFQAVKTIYQVNELLEKNDLYTMATFTEDLDTDNTDTFADKFVSTANKTLEIDPQKITQLLDIKQKKQEELNNIILESALAFMLFTDKIIETF